MTLLFLEDMDVLGLSSSKDRNQKQWAGEKGVAYLEFQQQEQNDQTLVRSTASGRGLLCSVSMIQERLTTRIKRQSIAEKDVLGLIEDLQDMSLIADHGWYPRPIIPQAAIDRVKKRRPAGVAVDDILQRLVKEQIEPVYQLALKEKSAITDAAHEQDVLDNLVRNPVIGMISSGSGSSGGVLGAIGSSASFLRIRMQGRAVTPDAVVMKILWGLLTVIYAASEDAEREFYSMGVKGRQGKLDLRAFAEEVSRMYTCVEHISSISVEELPVVFYKGLNSDRSFNYAKEEMGKNRTMPLDDLVDLLEEYERHSHVEEIVESKTARLLPAAARSSSRSSGRSSTLPFLGDSSGGVGKNKLEQLKSHRSSQLQKMEVEDPAGYMLIIHAIEMAESYPGHPAAICLDCGTRGKLHVNEKCPQKKQVNFANAVEHIPSSAGSHSQSNGSGRGSSAGQPRSEQPGLFRAVPKPEANKGRGNRSYGYQNEKPAFGQRSSSSDSNSRCEFCGFAQGHESGICYYRDPRAAPPAWPGPSDRTPPELVLAYLERCAQQQVPPRIRRCTATIEQLRTAGRLTPAMWDVLSPGSRDWAQQRRQPGTPVAAAAQLSPWQVTKDPMLPGNPWNQEQTTPGPAPVTTPFPTPPGLNLQQPPAAHNVTHVAASAYSHPAGASSAAGPSSSSAFGYNFAMSAWCEDIEPVAAAATRSSTRKNSDELKRASEKPKSFLPSKLDLYPDANSNRGSRPEEGPATSAPADNGDSERLAKAYQRIQAILTAGRELDALISQLSVDLMTRAEGTPQQEQVRAAVLASMEVPGRKERRSRLAEAERYLEAAETVSPATDPASSPNGKQQPAACSAVMVNASLSSNGRVRMPLELTFQPPKIDYILQQSKRQGLDRLCCHSKRTGLTLVTPDDRAILLDGVFVDSGANVLLVTEAFCKEIGLFFRRCDQVPGVRGYGGTQDKKLVGITHPFKLVLAMGTPHATTLHVSRAFVVPGDAGGMYKMCLDKQTVFPVYGHVHPEWQHFVWNPEAAKGNTKLVAGIPITASVDQLHDAMVPFAAVDLEECYACIADAQEEAVDLQQQLEVLEAPPEDPLPAEAMPQTPAEVPEDLPDLVNPEEDWWQRLRRALELKTEECDRQVMFLNQPVSAAVVSSSEGDPAAAAAAEPVDASPAAVL